MLRLFISLVIPFKQRAARAKIPDGLFGNLLARKACGACLSS